MFLKYFNLFLTGLVYLGFLSGCGDNQKEKEQPTKEQFIKGLQPEIERKAKVRQAIHGALGSSTDPEVTAWHDFLSRWPSAKQNLGFAWYEDKQKFQGGVEAIALIEDRYLLHIILDCDVSKDCTQVTFTKLRFNFEEVEKVQIRSEGGSDVTFNTENGKWFNLKDWEQLKTSNWDFAKISINVVSNAPVPNIRSAF